MSTNPQMPTLSRRNVLSLGVGVAAGAVLAGCGNDSRSPGHSSKKLSVPVFEPARKVPGSIASANPLVPLAVESFPPSPYTSVAKTPASGGKISAYQLIWGSPPPPLSHNKWLQGLNQHLGAQWQATYVPSDSYATKVATMLASGSIPDVCWIQPDANAPTAQAVQQGAFADLTDALAGDAIKAYPNLAHIPTEIWQRSSINGSIYGVPQPLQAYNEVAVYRSDWAEKLGYPQPPKNADEILELFTAFSKGHPAGSRQTWGIGGFDGSVSFFVYDMFRVPNTWRLSKGGTFTYYIESDEYEAALTYMNRMWKAGVFHPDALLNPTQGTKVNDLFTSGRTGFYRASPGGWWYVGGSGLDAFQKANPDATVTNLVTPGHDGGNPNNSQTNGWWGIGAISASAGKTQKRLEELLRVLDYWAAPFGSSEYVFLNQGIEGRQFTYDAKGNPIPSSNAKLIGEMGGNYFITPASTILYYPGATGRAKIAQDYLAKQLEHSAANPTLGLVSQTNIKKSAALTQLNTSYENDMVTGRKPLSALKEWRSRWRSEGGDKIRKEYEDALRTSKQPGH